MYKDSFKKPSLQNFIHQCMKKNNHHLDSSVTKAGFFNVGTYFLKKLLLIKTMGFFKRVACVSNNNFYPINIKNIGLKKIKSGT
jgi:hypothetical protein